MAAGSLMETVEKVGPDRTVIAPHAPSVKSQTLQKKAFPVTDRHGPSVAFLHGPQVGDEGLYGTRI